MDVGSEGEMLSRRGRRPEERGRKERLEDGPRGRIGNAEEDDGTDGRRMRSEQRDERRVRVQLQVQSRVEGLRCEERSGSRDQESTRRAS